MMSNLQSRRWLVGSVAVLGVFVGIPAAKAVLQVFTATGIITSITSGSELESVLSVGDPFVAVAVYDDALLTGVGDEEISLDPNVNPDHSFDLMIGDPAVFTFNETDDEDFGGGSGFAEIEFFNGDFDGFDFISNEFELNGVSFDVHLGESLRIDNEEGDEEPVEELAGEIETTSQEPVSPD
jgi:hypothetical protein